MCPACGEGVIDPDSFRFKESVLIEDTEDINEPEETETDLLESSQPGESRTKGKIDDHELLKMVDEEDLSQVAATKYFSCSKQAISKRLKVLRRN